MAQNPMRINRTTQEVDAKLHSILKSIHILRVEFGNHSDGFVNYASGANLSGFIKVANAMRDQGLV